jgi:hypothetical protein
MGLPFSTTFGTASQPSVTLRSDNRANIVPHHPSARYSSISWLLMDQKKTLNGKLACRWIGQDGSTKLHQASASSEFCKFHRKEAEYALGLVEGVNEAQATTKANGVPKLTARQTRTSVERQKALRTQLVQSVAEHFHTSSCSSQIASKPCFTNLMMNDPEGKVSDEVSRTGVQDMHRVYKAELQQASTSHVPAARSTFEHFKTRLGQGTVDDVFATSVCLRIAEINLRKKEQAGRSLDLS